MVKSIRLINLNDTSKDDANSFWISFSTWISQNNVRESLFTEEYVEKTTEKFYNNLQFYNTQYRLYYGKEYPYYKMANEGLEEEYLKDFLKIMYELWVRNNKKREFAIEVNRRLRKANLKFQISDTSALECSDEEKKDLFLNINFIQDFSTRNELLKDIFTILSNMQGNSIYKKSDENGLNDGFRDGLKNTRRYQVHDQTRHGESESGQGPGELDVLVSTKEEDLPIAVVEALILKGMDRNSLKKHIDKALMKYNPTGCPNTTIAIYARSSDFAKLMLELSDYLRQYEFPYEVKDEFDEIDTGYTESRHWKLDLIRSDKDIVLHIYAFNML